MIYHWLIVGFISIMLLEPSFMHDATSNEIGTDHMDPYIDHPPIRSETKVALSPFGTWDHFLEIDAGSFWGEGRTGIKIEKGGFSVQPSPSSGSAILSVSFIGSSGAQPEGENGDPALFNYYIGNGDPSWRESIRAHRSMIYRELYPSIDLRITLIDGDPKTDWIVHPGGDPSDIRIRYSGGSPRVNGQYLELDLGLREGPLYTYQEGGPVESGYILNGGFVSFSVPEFDVTKDLIIDPLLVRSTYLGGYAYDLNARIKMDDEGLLYIAGDTESPNLPGATNSFEGNIDMFIACMDEDLIELKYLTFIGGAGYDEIGDIALDIDGTPYITGVTDSTDFPTTIGANMRTKSGAKDGMLASFDPSGGLKASTYLGGSSNDVPDSLSIRSDGGVVVAGYTVSDDLWTHSEAYSPSISGDEDGFVMIFDEDLSTITHSTYFGGSNFDDMISDILVLDDGSILLGGQALSWDFPVTTGSYKTEFGAYIGFLTVLDNELSSIERSTFTGNGSWISAMAIHADRVYITGKTLARSYPTTSDALDRSFTGEEDVFLSIMDLGLTDMIYSTFIGADETKNGDPYFDYYEAATDISVDGSGNICIVGFTDSEDFPITLGAVDETRNELDGFLMVVEPEGSHITYSTFLGGFDEDRITGICLNGSGGAVIVGYTYSNDLTNTYPVKTGSFDTSFNGMYDIVLSKFKMDSTVPSAIIDPTVINGTDWIHLEWSPPMSDGNERLIGYRVWRWTDPRSVAEIGSMTNTFYNDTGLSKGVTFYYLVRAYNIVGLGERVYLSGIALSEPTIPIISSTETGDGYVYVQWNPPLDNGGFKELDYFLELRLDNQPVNISRTREMSFRFDDLLNGRTYTFIMQAENPKGNSPRTNPITLIPAGLPSEPRNLTWTPFESSVELRWEIPISNGGLPNLTYGVYVFDIEDDLLRFNYPVDELNFLVSPLMNGRPYRILVHSFNPKGKGGGSSVNVTTFGPVSRIEDLYLEQDNRSIIATWSVPSIRGGASSLLYDIYLGIDTGEPTLVGSVNDTIYIVRNVTFGTRYTFRIAARNTLFESELSDPASIVPYWLPSSPIDPTFEIGDDSILFTWSPPSEDGGDPDLEYRIYFGRSDGSIYVSASTRVTEHKFTSLKKGVRYHAAVSAVNKVGEGYLSEIINGTPYSKPSEPINLRYIEGSGYLNISWDPPLDDGGSPIIGYLLYFGETPEVLELKGMIRERSYFISGLQNGRPYHIRVTTLNDQGESNSSAEIIAIPMTYPGSPVITEVLPGDGYAEVFWEPPIEDGGSDIWTYHIYLAGPDGPDDFELVRSVVPSTRSYTFDGLENGKEYSVMIRSENSYGLGQGSDPMSFRPIGESIDEGPDLLLLVLLGILSLMSLIAIAFFFLSRSQRQKGMVRRVDRTATRGRIGNGSGSYRQHVPEE